ncbi:hypothetical protein J7T55_015106 [Diaporthe amygdali]|uniref:uncharacterized protein n=1 Tax=Phomopsis amygdali TaxID=1214568 RepID=UPI0022FED060|nr:uncharacterized protein J7T55_015106 [Diaporthe amygdali]KAJ0108672.1 hypothetical protein J7T55_015106 [Diaporthe amygdali]
MPGLCDLPDEVILLSLTTRLLRAADLAALALSCRRLKAVAEDALYTQDRERNRSSVVHWAAEHGNTATLDKALKHRLDINEASLSFISRPSPLQTAVEYGQDLAVGWFLDHGADVSQEVHCRCHSGVTGILHVALCLGRASTAQLLISRGAPLEYPSVVAETSGAEYTDALLEASFHGLDAVVEVLVKDHGMNLQTLRGSHRIDTLAFAAFNNDNVLTIRTLVGLGANVDGIHKEWLSSPLHFALDEGNFAVADALLDLGAKVTSYEYEFEVNTEDEQVAIAWIQVEAAPLVDTIASIINRRAVEGGISAGRSVLRESAESWRAERAALMKRLVELGADIDMEHPGLWVPGYSHDMSPLGVAIAIGDVQDVADLIALGANVNPRMLADAWDIFATGEDESMEKIKILLKHGIRLDEPLRGGMSMLQLAVTYAVDFDTTSGLHDILRMSSTKNLSSDYLDEVLAECLGGMRRIASLTLVRHGARVSCKNKLFSIAICIAEHLELETREEDNLDDIDVGMTCPETEPQDCMGIILDMGLSSEDQCLIFQTVLNKRQLTLAHLFLDRGLAGRPEAALYLPAYLMLAASWGNICVIKRLWQHVHGTPDPTLLLFLQQSITSGNREAASFFVDHGATAFERLTPTQIFREHEMRIKSLEACLSAVRMLRGFSGTEGSSDRLWMQREYRKMEIFAARHPFYNHALIHSSPFQLAVRYGHIGIVRDLLEAFDPADADAISRCGKVHIPCVLRKANEIRELIQERGIECDGDNPYAT